MSLDEARAAFLQELRLEARVRATLGVCYLADALGHIALGDNAGAAPWLVRAAQALGHPLARPESTPER